MRAILYRRYGGPDVLTYEETSKPTPGDGEVLIRISNRSLAACRRVLTPHGTYVFVGSSRGGPWLGPIARLLTTRLMSPFVSHRLTVAMTRSNAADLATLADLMNIGRVTPVIDRRHELRETADAIRYVERGHARGKVVIRVA